MLITPHPFNALLNKLAVNVPNNTGRSPPFCCFALFLTVLLIHFINNTDSLNDLTIFKTSSISSFAIINAAVPDPIIFFE